MTPKPQIGLIGLDFDWTLMNHNPGGSKVPPETIDILTELCEEGIFCGLASGRYWWEMRDELEAQGLPWGDPFPSFFCTRETFIYWVGLDALEPDLEWNTARRAEMRELVHQISERQSSWRLSLEAAGLHPKRWWLWGDYGLEVNMGNPEDAQRARLVLAELSAELPLAETHRNGSLAHVVLTTATKGGCLRHAAETRGLRPDQVLAFGDSANDLSMLDGRYGLRSATMANGDDEVKAAVRANGGWITEGVASTGIHELLHEFRLRGWYA